jgi:hypothetical protein
MSIFGKIKDAIFGRKARAQVPHQAPATPQQPQAVPAATQQAPAMPQMAPTAPAQTVDVEAELAELAQGKNLNWRTSIVDLMKLLDIDSSLENRKELARELGYTGELNGSAEMNIWLHKATMRQLAANGGKVPAEMLD